VQKKVWLSLMGAAFLMATSAVGPGFLTQTSVFTAQFGASFGFVILASVLLDIGAQLNIWRLIVVSKRRAQDIAHAVWPGLGHVLSFLVVSGGLAFNIGNVAGAGLGFEVLFGVDAVWGAVISGLIAVMIFLSKEAGKVMDRFAVLLGFVMIGLTIWVAVDSHPPLGEAVVRSLVPDVPVGKWNAFFMAIVTVVGGSVGGYITFAGGHRLLDAGLKGMEALPETNRSSVSGIIITSVMRLVLFLATLGVVSAGGTLSESNPAASVFQLAAGKTGYQLFGLVMWAAAITSVVGAAYTSVSFIRTWHEKIDRHHRWWTVCFILLSTAVFVVVGKPVKTLILMGTLNGFILPLSLAIILLAARRKEIVGEYRHPLWLTVFGVLVAVIMTAMGVVVSVEELPKLWA
jgi:Mn2+/Fe2+ NRAMP family transporter